MKNLKSHYYKLIDSLTSYSICRPDIRFYCENINSQGKKQVVINTQSNNILSNIITQHWTIGYFKQLQPFLFIFNNNNTQVSQIPVSQSTQLSQSPTANNNLTNEMINNYWKNIGDLENEECIYGYISDGKTINNNEHQLLYLNFRPIDNNRIIKVFNQTWKSKGYNYHPNIILNIHLLPGNYDINLSPDKRDVMIKDENLLLEQLTNKLQFIWKPKSIRYDSNPSSQESQKFSNDDDILYSDNDDSNGINIPIDITDENNKESEIQIPPTNNSEMISNSISSSNNNISLSQSSLLSLSNNNINEDDNYMLVFSELPTQKCDNNNSEKEKKKKKILSQKSQIEIEDDDDNDFDEKIENQKEEKPLSLLSQRNNNNKLNIQLIDDDNSSNNMSLSSQSVNHKTSQSSNHSNISDVMMCDLDNNNSNDLTTPSKNQKRNSNSSRSRSRSTSPLIKRKIKEIISEERERRTKKKYDKLLKKNSERWEIPTLDVNDKDRRSEYVEEEDDDERRRSKKSKIDSSVYINIYIIMNSLI